MENLYIPKKPNENYFPAVNLNYKNGKCEIVGESFMESPDKFYDPIIDWLYQYTAIIKKPLEFSIKLSYYNTASSKFIIEILNILKIYINNGGNVEIKWYIDPDDISMEEEVQDLSKEVGVKITPIFNL